MKDKCDSIEHLVLKAKQKRGGKLYQEMPKAEVLKDLIRYDATVQIALSNFTEEERQNFKELSLQYRFKDHSLSEEAQIVIDRRKEKSNIHAQIAEIGLIHHCLKK